MARWRAWTKCPKCAGTAIVERAGADLDAFPEVVYQQCQSCGASSPLRVVNPKTEDR